MKDLEAKVAELQERIGDLDRQVNTIVDLNTRELVPALQERGQKADALAAEFSQFRKQHDQQIADLRREIQSVLQEMRRQLDTLREELGDLKATGSSSPEINGEYQVASGDRFRISRDGSALQITFIGGPNLVWASGRVFAGPDGVFRGTMTVAFREDPRHALRRSTISIRATDGGELYMHTDSVAWAANGRETSRTRVAMTLARCP